MALYLSNVDGDAYYEEFNRNINQENPMNILDLEKLENGMDYQEPILNFESVSELDYCKNITGDMLDNSEKDEKSTKENSQSLKEENELQISYEDAHSKDTPSKEADSSIRRSNRKRETPDYREEQKIPKGKATSKKNKSNPKKRDKKYNVKAKDEQSENASRQDVAKKAANRSLSFEGLKLYIINQTNENREERLSEKDIKKLYLETPLDFKAIIEPIINEYQKAIDQNYKTTLAIIYWKFVGIHDVKEAIKGLYPAISEQELGEIAKGCRAYNWLFERYAKVRYDQYWIPSLYAKVVTHIYDIDETIQDQVKQKASSAHKKKMDHENYIDFKEIVDKHIAGMMIQVSKSHIGDFNALLAAYDKYCINHQDYAKI